MTTMTAANPVLEADGPASNIGFAAYVHSSAPTLFRSTPPLAAAAVLLPSTEDPSPTPSSLPSFYYLKRLCPRAFFRLTVGIRSGFRTSGGLTQLFGITDQAGDWGRDNLPPRGIPGETGTTIWVCGDLGSVLLYTGRAG
jgi:hypothetical protein